MAIALGVTIRGFPFSEEFIVFARTAAGRVASADPRIENLDIVVERQEPDDDGFEVSVDSMVSGTAVRLRRADRDRYSAVHGALTALESEVRSHL